MELYCYLPSLNTMLIYIFVVYIIKSVFRKEVQMRKVKILLSALILTSALPLYAAFCINCGKNLPSGANFCPNCGTASSESFQTAEPESVTGSISNSTSSSINTIDNTNYNNSISIDSRIAADNKALADYHFINKIEESMTQSTSNVALRQCQELKRQNAAKLQQMENEYMNYSIYRRKIHDLHLRKLQALENYLAARKDFDRSVDTARARAKMNKELFVVDKMNEAIDMLLTGGNTLSNINKVEDLEKRVKKTTANYVVTSSYLTLGNIRIRRNEPIWIEDVSGANAKVHHMGVGVSDEPASGYVSIYDLEKRTNWVSDADFYYSIPTGSTVVLTQPARPEPTVNVVVWDGIYPYRRWHHFPNWGPPHHKKPAPSPAPAPAPAPAPRQTPSGHHRP